MESNKEFVNLHSHTGIGSLKDSLNDVNKLFDKVAEFKQKALAITDHGYLTAFHDAYKAYKRTGVKFIGGCEFYYVNNYDTFTDEKGKIKKEKRKHLLILAQNEKGYKNLLKLNFIGFQHQDVVMGKSFPKIDWENLANNAEGLIVTSACGQSPIARLIMEDKFNEAVEVAQKFAEIFPARFFIELHPHHLKVEGLDQHFINTKLIELAKKVDLPLTTGADTHYLTRQMEKYHDLLLAINAKKPLEDPDRHRYGIDEFYVKTGDEIFAFLAKYYGEDVAEEAVRNTTEIADMCEKPDFMGFSRNHLPVFPVKDQPDYKEFLEWKNGKTLPEDTAYMRYKCIQGFKEKFPNATKSGEEWKRIVDELKVLEGNNFSSYMLVVADFMNWAKNQGILTGYGRGSCCGSLVAYILGIHGVDPLKYNLLFERFQNAEKKALPDIDSDFTSAGRDRVLNYVINKYGAECCAHVSNINTYTPKNVIPDIVKTMRNIIPNLVPAGVNYVSVSNAIKDAIPDDAKTIEEALESSAKFRAIALKTPDLIEYAKNIVGLPKEYSTHAGGLVISDVPIIDFAPVRIDKNGEVAVQYDKDRCEEVGLVKMDFLALSTLDVIDETFKNIEKLGIADAPKSMDDIPLDDQKVYNDIQKGNTLCVFQLGKSSTMISLCKQIKPNCIEDIAVINALGRPSCGPKKMDDGSIYNARQDYIDRRFGKKKVEYFHPSLEKALGNTFGLGTFEEQLMSIARYFAGWNLNKADGLRKITKLKGKNPELALKLEADFIADAMKLHNVSYELGKEVWEKIVIPFGTYGFNKCLNLLNFFHTPYGWKSLSELKAGANIFSRNENNKLKITKIKEIGKTDRKMPVWRIKFANGGIVNATPNHKFLTPEGYVELHNIVKKALPIQIVENTIKPNWDLLDESNNKIRKLRKEGKSLNYLSSNFNHSLHKIKSILKGKVLNNKYEKTNKIDYSLNSEQSAYWFGFMCADANVNDRSIEVSLASYDLEHLIKLYEFFGISNWNIQNRMRSNSRSSVLSINSSELCVNLRKLGIPKNKNKQSLNTSSIPPEFFKHFLRGYFDGDGCVCIHEYKGKRINVGLRGRRDFLRQVRTHLEENIKTISHNKILKDGNSHSLWYRSKNDVKNILDYLYKDATIFLPRKRIRAERYFNSKEDFHPAKDLYRNDTPTGYTTIKSITNIGFQDTYYVEIDDDLHNYILDGGIVSANSHAVAYSINSYITAYLKYHYPTAFLTAYLKLKTEKGGLNRDSEIAIAKNECRRLNIKITPPDINRSGISYAVLDKNTIVMGFSAIKGLGDKAVEELVKRQPYNNMIEFLNLTDGRVVNKSKMEALAKAGCFDSFKIPRKYVCEEGKNIRDKFNAFVKKYEKKKEEPNIDDFPLEVKNVEWERDELLRYEHEVLGELVTGDIKDLFPDFFTGIGKPLSQIKNFPNDYDVVVEVIMKSLLREIKIKKAGKSFGKVMAKYQIEDVSGGQAELTIFPDIYKNVRDFIKEGNPIRAKCKVNEYNGTKSLVLLSIEKSY